MVVGRRTSGFILLAFCVAASCEPTLGQSRPSPDAKLKHPSSLCAVIHPSDADIAWECRQIGKGETLERLFGKRWVDVARFNRVDRRHAYHGVRIKVPRRLEEIANFTPLPPEYPPAKTDEQFILIDLAEQFLGAYEYGSLRFSMPVTTGEAGNETPTGLFRITALHRQHKSCLYTIEGTDTPYPMNYALHFFVTREGVSYWIHGRDVPGYPASHGCVGLYDEAMQKEYYGVPQDPELDDAKRLYEWVLGNRRDDGKVLLVEDGPKILIRGAAPR
ncbi:MAG: L,D-transpeptidase [Nitrospirota bacterium]